MIILRDWHFNEPVDATEEAQRLLNAKTVKLTVRARTADLLVRFVFRFDANNRVTSKSPYSSP
jgi:hypothetical protein